MLFLVVDEVDYTASPKKLRRMVDVRGDDRHTILEGTRSQVDEPWFSPPRGYEGRNHQQLGPHQSQSSGALRENDIMADQDSDRCTVDRDEPESGTLGRPSFLPPVEMHLVLTR